MAGFGLLTVWLVHTCFVAYYTILLVRVVLSFLRLPPWHWASRTIGSFCYRATEPLLAPVRRAIDRYQRNSGLDFSPIVLYVLLLVCERVITMALLRLGL